MKKAIILGLCLTGGLLTHAAQAEIRVVASIKPVHSLVSAVMGDVGTPELIIDGVASPHAYALRPSQAQALQTADVVFWIGPGLEQFMVKPLATTGQNARSVALINSDGLTRRPYRGGHHDHDHGQHQSHDKDEHEEHEHEKHGKEAHDHGDHDSDEVDPHVWLDPENARVMLRKITDVLSEQDPKSAAAYRQNAEKMDRQLVKMTSELTQSLAGLKNARYVVFHNAYQYFEARMGMAPVAAITLNPDVAPGAEQLRRIKHEIAEKAVVCVFAEPQFDPKLVKLVVEGSSAKSAELDPLGSAVASGANHYIQTIRQMAESFRACLS